MVSQEKAKEELKNLVTDFKNCYPQYKRLAESNIETKLVEELFIKVLGWDKKDFIKIVSELQQQPIIKLVDRMLSLNKQLQEIGDKKTAQTAKLEDEIRKTDEEIDELVYKIYGITEKENNIIEESLK